MDFTSRISLLLALLSTCIFESILCQSLDTICTVSTSSSGCKTCSSIYKCSSCRSSTEYPSGPSCFRCQTGCSSCSSASFCSSCSSSYYMISNTCYPCSNGCSSCTQFPVFSPTTSSCLTCKKGYVRTSGTTSNNPDTCTECSFGCNTCQLFPSIMPTTTTCGTCASRYYKITGATASNADTCGSCSTECSACTNSSTCTTCASGYKLNGSACEKTYSSSSGAVIGGSVAGSIVLLVIIGVGIYCCYKCKQNKKNEEVCTESPVYKTAVMGNVISYNQATGQGSAPFGQPMMNEGANPINITINITGIEI